MAGCKRCGRWVSQSLVWCCTSHVTGFLAVVILSGTMGRVFMGLVLDDLVMVSPPFLWPALLPPDPRLLQFPLERDSAAWRWL